MELAVKTAFTQMLGAKGAFDFAKQSLDEYRKTLDLNRERLRAGDMSATDYKRLDLQLAQFESDYDNAHTNLVQASEQLQTLLGYDRPRPGFDITGSLTPPSITATLPDTEQKALQARPDFLAAQQSVRVADANVKLAYANGTTDPTIEGEYDRAGTFNSAGFQIGIPLRVFDRNQGEKARTKYEAQSSRFAETARATRWFPMWIRRGQGMRTHSRWPAATTVTTCRRRAMCATTSSTAIATVARRCSTT